MSTGQQGIPGPPVPDRFDLPCGCFTECTDDTFVFNQRCSAGADCTYARYVIEETRRQGKPFTILEDPEVH